MGIARALNGLETAIAEDEAGEGKKRSGPEPALLFLERPDLAAVARSEPRYAALYAEASRRLGAIYSRAAEDAASKLESSPTLARAAARALGSGAAGIAVRASDLSLPPNESGRRIAFFASASDASGLSIDYPLPAEMAAAEYAAAFSRVAGLEPAKLGTAELLSRFGQLAVCAYGPEDSDDSYVLDYFPKGRGSGTSPGSYPSLSSYPSLLADLDLELALLGGWRP